MWCRARLWEPRKLVIARAVKWSLLKWELQRWSSGRKSAVSSWWHVLNRICWLDMTCRTSWCPVTEEYLVQWYCLLASKQLDSFLETCANTPSVCYAGTHFYKTEMTCLLAPVGPHYPTPVRPNVRSKLGSSYWLMLILLLRRKLQAWESIDIFVMEEQHSLRSKTWVNCFSKNKDLAQQCALVVAHWVFYAKKPSNNA